jgi:hypothetical protein
VAVDSAILRHGKEAGWRLLKSPTRVVNGTSLGAASHPDKTTPQQNHPSQVKRGRRFRQRIVEVRCVAERSRQGEQPWAPDRARIVESAGPCGVPAKEPICSDRGSIRWGYSLLWPRRRGTLPTILPSRPPDVRTIVAAEVIDIRITAQLGERPCADAFTSRAGACAVEHAGSERAAYQQVHIQTSKIRR